MRRYFYIIKMSRAHPSHSSNSTSGLQTQVTMDRYHKHADDIRKPQCKKWWSQNVSKTTTKFKLFKRKMINGINEQNLAMKK